MYGASKLAGERGIEHAKGPHLIVRTSWIHFARGKNFLRTIARLAAERDELRIVADQIGSPTSAAWVAEAIANIFERGPHSLPATFSRLGHKVNIAAAGETSWHGFAIAIVDGLRRRGLPIRANTITAIRAANIRLELSAPITRGSI